MSNPPTGIAGFERNPEALAEEKAKVDKTTSEFGANADMLYLLPGQTMIRVLPPYNEKGLFFNKVFKHRVKTGDDVFTGLCPEKNYGESCALCDKGEELFATKDEAAMELAKELRPRGYYLYNVLCFAGPANRRGEMPEPGKVYVMESGVMVHRQIIELDQDEATGWADITNIEGGVNLIIKRTGAGLDTKYDVNVHGGGRTNIVEWLQSSAIDPGSMTLYDLEAVYNRPADEKIQEVASKVRNPVTLGSSPAPVFQTAAPAPAPPAPQPVMTPAPNDSIGVVSPSQTTGPVPVPVIPAPPTK